MSNPSHKFDSLQLLQYLSSIQATITSRLFSRSELEFIILPVDLLRPTSSGFFWTEQSRNGHRTPLIWTAYYKSLRYIALAVGVLAPCLDRVRKSGRRDQGSFKHQQQY